MIPQTFEYSAPKTLTEALSLVESGGKPLAGGMSLIPMMKLRLAAPELLVDLARVKDLNYIREEKGELHIGATATHYSVESSALVGAKCPLLAAAASSIGDVQVRNVGTIGGSVAHADPAADYPAAACRSRGRLSGGATGAGGEDRDRGRKGRADGKRVGFICGLLHNGAGTG